jgi:hypothetical protein
MFRRKTYSITHFNINFNEQRAFSHLITMKTYFCNCLVNSNKSYIITQTFCYSPLKFDAFSNQIHFNFINNLLYDFQLGSEKHANSLNL